MTWGRARVPEDTINGCEIFVWAHGADPEKDDVLWLESYLPKWAQSDTEVVTVCVQRLYRDIQDAEKLHSK